MSKILPLILVAIIATAAYAARASVVPPDGAYQVQGALANGYTDLMISTQPPLGFKALDYKLNGSWHRANWDPILDCWVAQGGGKRFYIANVNGNPQWRYSLAVMVPVGETGWGTMPGGAIGMIP